MYSNELKVKIKTLLDKNNNVNKWIYIPSYVDKFCLQSLLDEVISTTVNLNPARLDERIFCIKNDINNKPLCLCGCGNTVKFKRFNLGYALYSSVKCRANDKVWQSKVKFTNVQNYGVESISQLPKERLKRSLKMREIIPNMDFTYAVDRRRKTIETLYGIGTNTGWNSKGIITRINNKNMIPIELKTEYKEYSTKVIEITRRQDLSVLDNIDKRGTSKEHYHVDHMFSIFDCFMNDVPVVIAGNIANLKCIPSGENSKKRNRSSITLTELYERYNARI